MKQIKLVSLLCALVFIAACSSSGPRSDENSENSDYADVNTPAAAHGKATPEKKEAAVKADEAEPTPTMPVSSAASSALDEAIRTNNDEVIHRAAISVLAQNAQDIKALNAVGMYHYRKGQYPAAQLMFTKAMKINPNVSELHNNLGLVHLALKDQREAIKSFRKALEINPRDGIAAANVGAIYINEKDYTKALVAMEIAYKKNPKDVRVLNNYGVALTASSRYDEAKDIYKEGLKLQNSDKDLMLNYAILLIDHMNKGQDGMEMINKLRFLGPSPEARNRINALENKVKSTVK